MCVRLGVCVCLATRATTSENHKQTSKDIYGGQATTVERETEWGKELKKRKLITQRYERKYTQAHTQHTHSHAHPPALTPRQPQQFSFICAATAPASLTHRHRQTTSWLRRCVTYTPCCTGDNAPTWGTPRNAFISISAFTERRTKPTLNLRLPVGRV